MTPRTLDALRALPPGADRIAAASAYIAERQAAIDDARAIRNGDIRALVAKHGVAETSRMTGIPQSTVKLVKGQG